MARIYRTTYPLRNKDGSLRKGPDGKTLRRKSRKWYIEYVDGEGIPRRKAGFTDKSATIQLAAELERAAARRQSGLVDRFAEHRKRPLTVHLDEWHAALLHKGNTATHADLSRNRVRRIFTDCRFTFWPDMIASRVAAFISDLRGAGTSIQSANHYLLAVKSFSRWMVRDGRALDSPLAHLQAANAEIDKRHERRALSADETRWLIDTADDKGIPDWRGISGPERAMLYRTAVETGLRAAELRSLTAGSFRLDDDPPTVTVAAGYSKHRREDVLPIRSELAEALATHFTGKYPTAAALTLPQSQHVSAMMRFDLRRARAAWIRDTADGKERRKRLASTVLTYRDDANRVVDFHSLRHTFISTLARGGVHPKLAQQLARHSTIALTMDRYTHSVMGDLHSALDALPDLDSGSGRKTCQRATGTLGREVGATVDATNQPRRVHDNSDTAKKHGGMHSGKHGDMHGGASVRSGPLTTIRGRESNSVKIENARVCPSETERSRPLVSPDVSDVTPKAAVGFEPTNNGFAIRPLEPLGYAAGILSGRCTCCRRPITSI